MSNGIGATCVNHVHMEAVVRCKQCSRPICAACIIAGATGRFCSAACKEKHEAFTERAQKMDGKARSAFFVKLRALILTIIIFLAVAFAAGFLASTVEIPILTDLTWAVRDRLGI